MIGGTFVKDRVKMDSYRLIMSKKSKASVFGIPVQGRQPYTLKDVRRIKKTRMVEKSIPIRKPKPPPKVAANKNIYNNTSMNKPLNCFVSNGS